MGSITHVRRLLVVVLALAVVVPLAGTAVAHDERDVTQPDDGVFPEYRHSGPSVVVCKDPSAAAIEALPAPIRQRNEALLERCRFEHIQEAVNWVEANGEPGYRILVMPGVYREEPSRRSREANFGAPLGRDDLADECAAIWEASDGGEGALTYTEQRTCPHIKNLVGIFGDTTPDDDSQACDGNLCDLQIEGTGARPYDVIVDGKLDGFLNGIKVDRGDGFYVRNMGFQHFEFNGLYIIETAGATVDSSIGSFNHEYGFLSFVSYVLYENCSGQANGDAAVYPGASPDVNADAGLIPLHRDEMVWSTEVRGCRGHHNELGFSGTTGNSVWIHHNEFDHNIAGINLDTFFPDHPGTPQNHALVEDNLLHSNNVDHYDTAAHRGLCAEDVPYDERDYEDGALCPVGPAMLGSGVINPGGNFNWYHRNRFYDNWRTGVIQFWVPAELREGEPVPGAHDNTNCGPDGDQPCPYEETSHWNTYSGNRLAEEPLHGHVQPNGADWTWDVEGQGNCWAQTETDVYQPNTSAAGDVTYHVIDESGAPSIPFPDCAGDRSTTYSPVSSVLENSTCATYDQATNPDPEGCEWVEMPPMPDGRQPENPTLQRLAGGDRIDTAILASQEGYPTSAPTVTLARADLYPDALAGAPLAHARGGPMLLTDSDGVDARVAREIARLGATQVILLGGTDALSSRVEQDLRGLGFSPEDVVRIGGVSRYETAAMIAENLPATDAFVAKGDDPDSDGWPDALAASAVAPMLERPILLTPPGELAAATDAFLARGDIESVDIVGGVEAVSEEAERAIAARVDEVERVAGANRFETALEMGRFALKAGADPTELWLATGEDWPDGIAAGSAVAVDEGVMLLVGGAIGDGPVATWLDEVHPYLDTDGQDVSVGDVLENVRVLGGTEAVPAAVDDELRGTFGAEPGDAVGDRSAGTVVQLGRFRALPGSDAAYGDVTGYAVMERRLDGATRTRVFVRGLPTGEGTVHPVHVHSEPCGSEPVADNPHYAQDPDGPAAEPNEIHPAFATGPGGTGLGDSTVFHHPRDDSLSVMIHSPEADGASKQLCADLR